MLPLCPKSFVCRTKADRVTRKQLSVVIYCAGTAQPDAKRQCIGTDADVSQTVHAPSASGLAGTTVPMPDSEAVDMKPQASNAPAAPGNAAALDGAASGRAPVAPPVGGAPLSSVAQAAVPVGDGPEGGPKLQGPPSKVAAAAVTAAAPVTPAKAGLGGGINHPIPSPTNISTCPSNPP